MESYKSQIYLIFNYSIIKCYKLSLRLQIIIRLQIKVEFSITNY